MQMAAKVLVGYIAAVSAGLLALPAPKLPDPPKPTVLVIEHTYDGPIEYVGTLHDFQYVGDALRLEFVPDGDGIFRNGFQGRAQ